LNQPPPEYKFKALLFWGGQPYTDEIIGDVDGNCNVKDQMSIKTFVGSHYKGKVGNTLVQ
jgi:hypothetical protein